MRAMRATGLMIVAFLVVAGCQNKEQPFKEPGAAMKYRNYVPPDAQIVAEGTGILKFTPKTNGTLYLLDLSDMVKVEDILTPRVVAVGGPLPGPELVFDPQTATVTRAGQSPLKLTKVVPGDRYQLRWEPEKPR